MILFIYWALGNANKELEEAGDVQIGLEAEIGGGQGPF